MGKKLKVIQIGFLVVFYFFLVNGCISDSSLHLQDATTYPAKELHSRRFNGNGIFPSASNPEQTSQESNILEAFYLLDSLGSYYSANTTVVIPEGTKILVVHTSNTSYSLELDGKSIPPGKRVEPSLGYHELRTYSNNTLYVRYLSIVTREAYASQHVKNAEPLGLWLKASIIAAIFTAFFFPLGMYIKYRRAKEVIL